MEIRISVRNLVEFVLRGGDIDNRRHVAADVAMQEGGRVHRILQRQMEERPDFDYHSEVALRHEYTTSDYTIIIDGRMDGLLIPFDKEESRPAAADADSPDNPQLITVDEIKGTYRDISKMRAPVLVHQAQAMCYAYIYAAQNQLPAISVRMIYVNFITEALRLFPQTYSFAELSAWFENLIREYRKWADHEYAWRKVRSQSIKELSFPFPYRDGQEELMACAYQSIKDRRKLFIQAPTGTGKTISTLYPAIKAAGEGLVEKIFYLTAKTITRTVADETFQLLRGQGLRFKTVILTARDKICFIGEADCNPAACPYAEGHFDRVNDAMYALLTESDYYDRDSISAYARRFRVCPFELGLDLSLHADAVIGDYNYLFDPRAYLRRYFAEGSRRDFCFLIDEAHNLVERGRDMYSASLRKADILALAKKVRSHAPDIAKELMHLNRVMLALKRETGEFMEKPYLEPLNDALGRLLPVIEKNLEDHASHPWNPALKKDVLYYYFELLHFRGIYEKMDVNYKSYAQTPDTGGFFVKLFCLNPADNLRECMSRGRVAMLFSATLLPMEYYKQLLGAVPGDNEIYARSVFRPDKRGLFIAADVTSKYERRGEGEYMNIARHIREITNSRHGNYLAFFPSHQFMAEVYGRFCEHFHVAGEATLILQDRHMDEAGREAFLRCFSESGANGPWTDPVSEITAAPARTLTDTVNGGLAWPSHSLTDRVNEATNTATAGKDRSLIGFCVLGGIFSEGIDLKHEQLIGAIIVGTGLPQICPEREILRRHFDGQGEDGFDFAYKLPGVGKVFQAAGRVIRSQEDIGIVALLDERFIQAGYRRLFPHEWGHVETVTLDNVARRIERFWDGWL